ncbi:MAG: LacI family DNA-binding transcriptional regulator [Luteolibacter sp.]
MTTAPMLRTGSDATIDDVALLAEVSIRTVSRVLNKSPKVKERTRERIEQAIATLNFRPSPQARALAMGRSFLIGLIHNDRNALVLDAIQRGIVEVTTRAGYELVVRPTPLEAGAAIRDVIAFAERSRVDGLIILPPVSGVPGLAQALAGAGVPCAALSAVPIPEFPDVILSEERKAGMDVARYLIDLGHRKLAIVNGPADTASATERRVGFVEEAARSGAQVINAPGDYGFASGVAAAEQLLSLSDRPTAIFAVNDVMAAGVLKVAAERAIAVPAQLSVVGFDGSLLTQMVSPPLTSVLRPFGDMAGAAAARLIARLEGDLPPRCDAQMQLVVSQSSGPPPT